jgi:hypothetical protein
MRYIYSKVILIIYLGVRRMIYKTNFENEKSNDFIPNTVDAYSRNRHQQVPSMLIHSNGQILVSCRWDEVAKSQTNTATASFKNLFGELLEASAEGDATNEQALYYSKDNGNTWTMANDGNPIITLKNGTSFSSPSSICHSVLFEDEFGDTWLYYTINQPNTWGSDRPDRSTGGGEIRRIKIQFDGDTWRVASESEIIWGFMQPVSDRCGGFLYDIRLACINKITKLSNGSLLMPVDGRSTVEHPKGAYWKMNRCWFLESRDGGKTWPYSHFVGGSDSMCLCEPTVVETKKPGHLITYMRIGYNTGNQLYRSVSTDYGKTWLPPEPAGLPNTSTSGTKPFLTRLKDGSYILFQTNEHYRTDRTNMSVFLTDEEGIWNNKWKLVKTIGMESDSKWKGSCYGWVEEGSSENLYLTYVSFMPGFNYLNFVSIPFKWLYGTVIEPNGISDRYGNHIPRIVDGFSNIGNKSLMFSNTRGRVIASQFGSLENFPFYIKSEIFVEKLPESQEFHLLLISTNNGRDLSFSVALRPAENNNIWLFINGGWKDSKIPCPIGKWFSMECRILDNTSFSLEINGIEVNILNKAGKNKSDKFFMNTSTIPDTMIIGGTDSDSDPCAIYFDSIEYGDNDI